MKITTKIIKENLHRWETINEVWEKPVIPEQSVTRENLELFVFQSYLHMQSVQKVAEIVNKLGFRKQSAVNHTIKYASGDISDIIRSHDCEDKKLCAVCRYIMDENSKAIDKLFN